MPTAFQLSNNRHYDRRQSMPFFCAFHMGIKRGRRRNQRREMGGKPVYVDSYSGRLVLCTSLILLLSALDAFLTLNILANGGEELNWLMAILLEDSVEKFVGFKLALTAMALILLIIHHDVQIMKWFRVRYFKYMILSGYSILIGYEIYLLELAAAVDMLN
ncbi:hypothetical protein ABF87_13605 [Nitrosomonas sp. JL21]|uniref:DUF5658 family protein n=1 Tax=Nitrosomonas sp. JL21 TaxID=153949 RepID=UPI0013681B9B|nr:DUF5658 family protein [Nitrosomonas sp. JL21]MBL8498593.1 hypothetical protein [Nitrosomonas sp.]MCC7090495.1 hypothetical protein [Nitrosomonas sp.]MXS78973.1 hypothetical protein [Nitrosomonas sp. JL21]